MVYSNSVLMLNILHRDFPDVAGIITDRIQQSLPKNKLKNIDLVSDIVNEFIRLTEIKIVVWAKSKSRVSCRLTGDEYRLVKVTEVREMLIAVVLMFFHPEKILGFTTECAERGLVKRLSELLACHKVRISIDVTSSVSYYKNYKSFKAEVDYLYHSIKAAGGYFE